MTAWSVPARSPQSELQTEPRSFPSSLQDTDDEEETNWSIGSVRKKDIGFYSQHRYIHHKQTFDISDKNIWDLYIEKKICILTPKLFPETLMQSLRDVTKRLDFLNFHTFCKLNRESFYYFRGGLMTQNIA